MNKKTLYIICSLLFSAWIFTTVGLCGTKVFRFDPPKNTVCFLTVTTTTTRQADEHTPVIDVVKKKWKITYQKEEGRIQQIWEPRSVMTSRDGRVFTHPVHTALMEFPFTLTLAPTGEVLSVEGLAGVQARLKGRVPETAWASLAPLISEDMLSSGEAYDWKLLTGECVGKKAETGEAWQGVETLGLAKRSGRPYFRLARVRQWIPYAGRRMLKVEEFRNTDFDALKKMAGGGAADFSAAAREDVNEWKDDEEGVEKILSGQGFRIIDPENLLLYYVYLNLVEHTIFKSPGGESSVLKLDETREFRFDYLD
jgi:hypothetical protein